MDLKKAIDLLAKNVDSNDFNVDSLLSEINQQQNTAKFETVLKRAVLDGQISTFVWHQYTTINAPKDLLWAFANFWNEMVTQNIFSPLLGFPASWEYEPLRLWAHIEHWHFAQDEDIFLMEDSLIPILLKIVQERGFSKRSYILDIIAHHIRDQAFEKAGDSDFEEYLELAATYISAAKSAGDNRLVSYLRRLKNYNDRVKVDQAGALQRGLDLTRCNEPQASDVDVVRQGKGWIVKLPGIMSKTLKISVVDGKIGVVQ